MTEDRFNIGLSIKKAMDHAETVHPGCAVLKALHARLGELLENHRSELTPEQYIALGGGTGKTDPE